MPGTWALLCVVSAVHLVSAAWLWSQGAQWWWALGGVRSEHARLLLGGQVSPLVAHEPWRLLTSVWLHVDGLHLTLNLLAIGTLGRILEPWTGARRLWAWFAVGGAAGSLLPHLAGVVRSDGASGGAFAWLCALVVLAWRNRARIDSRDWPLLGPGLTALLAANLALSVAIPQIDALAHIGGGVVGAAMAMVPATRWVVAAEWMIIGGFLLTCAVGWT